jgi:hypothetical protein
MVGYRNLMNLGLFWKNQETSVGIISFLLTERYRTQQKIFQLDIETHQGGIYHIEMTPKKLANLIKLLGQAQLENEHKVIGKITR